MTDEKGALDGGQAADVNKETSTHQDGGDGANVDVDKLKQELESLQKATSGKDAKISELVAADKELKTLREQMEKDNLAKKSVEEQNEHYKNRLDKIEREQTLARELSGLGVSVDDAKTVLEAGTPDEQAKALAGLLKSYSDKTSEQRLNEFKQAAIADTEKELPKTTQTDDNAFLDKLKSSASQ